MVILNWEGNYLGAHDSIHCGYSARKSDWPASCLPFLQINLHQGQLHLLFYKVKDLKVELRIPAWLHFKQDIPNFSENTEHLEFHTWSWVTGPIAPDWSAVLVDLKQIRLVGDSGMAHEHGVVGSLFWEIRELEQGYLLRIVMIREEGIESVSHRAKVSIEEINGMNKSGSWKGEGLRANYWLKLLTVAWILERGILIFTWKLLNFNYDWFSFPRACGSVVLLRCCKLSSLPGSGLILIPIAGKVLLISFYYNFNTSLLRLLALPDSFSVLAALWSCLLHQSITLNLSIYLFSLFLQASPHSALLLCSKSIQSP